MTGLVYKSTGSWYTVKTLNGKVYECRIKGKFRIKGIKSTNPISVGDIRHLVSDLKNRGIGVLVTDHNVRETLEVVDRAYILHEGQVLMSGTPSEVVRNENVRRVYLGENFKIS